MTVTRLAERVRANDGQQVRAMLEARPELVNMEQASNDEHCALHYAVLGRSPEIVRLLMQYGADARKGIYPHRDATSALTIATERGYDELVAIILQEEEGRDSESLQAGAEPDAAAIETDDELSDADGSSDDAQAMVIAGKGAELAAAAVASGDADWLRARHAEGALVGPALVDVLDSSKGLLTLFDPDEPLRVEGIEQVEYSSGGPLWHCAIDGKHAIAELLLGRGADPNAQVYAGGSAVFQAYGQRDAAMVELLQRHGGRADAATLGHYRQTELARQMIADADVDLLPESVTDEQELVEELLWGAACGGNPEIVQLALDRIDWQPEDARWYRILEQPLRLWNHMPSFWANLEFDRGTYAACFRLVLKRCDANVVGRSAFGLTILHDLAASREHVTAQERVEFATMLLDAGARMDVRDNLLKSTPFGWACRWGRVELVKLLLERGADPLEASAEPWATPRAWAQKKGHEAVLALLHGHRSG